MNLTFRNMLTVPYNLIITYFFTYSVAYIVSRFYPIDLTIGSYHYSLSDSSLYANIVPSLWLFIPIIILIAIYEFSKGVVNSLSGGFGYSQGNSMSISDDYKNQYKQNNEVCSHV